MTRRKELEAAERRRARVYETALAAGAVVVAAGLIAAFGAVLYAVVLAPRPAVADLEPGLLGRYRTTAGALQTSRVDSRIAFDSGDALLGDPAAVEWTGFLRIPIDGRYTFSIAPPGSAVLEIAGRPSLGAADLPAGHHALRLAYTKGQGRPEFRLCWESETRPREVVPAHSLFHAREGRGARNER